jgi:hypothetical protein
MKTNIQARTDLRSAIRQLQLVAKARRLESKGEGRDTSLSIQEASQLDEALRLLRWITD